MAAIRMLFSWLTEKGVLAMNPAREVKTERFSRAEGKTPAFVDAADMLKRRLKQAGLPAHYSPHSFRATGITNFLERIRYGAETKHPGGRRPSLD
jgi:site-specific recombinase XerD